MEMRNIAILFIKSLNKNQKENLKRMLSHDVMCGIDFARKHGVNPVLFNNELKDIFGGM